MNEEQNLFDPETMEVSEELKKMSRRTDPFTSKEAAAKALPKVGSEKATVLSIFGRFPDGLMDEQLEELAVKAGVWPGNASKRRSDLSRDGFLVWTGETKLTKANKKSKVWQRKVELRDMETPRSGAN